MGTLMMEHGRNTMNKTSAYTATFFKRELVEGEFYTLVIRRHVVEAVVHRSELGEQERTRLSREGAVLGAGAVLGGGGATVELDRDLGGCPFDDVGVLALAVQAVRGGRDARVSLHEDPGPPRFLRAAAVATSPGGADAGCAAAC